MPCRSQPSRALRRPDRRRLFIATSVPLVGLAVAGGAHAETDRTTEVAKESGAKPD